MLCIDVLKSSKEVRLYKGLSNNLDIRLEEHNSGQNLSTICNLKKAVNTCFIEHYTWQLLNQIFKLVYYTNEMFL